ncbi:sigma-70 family RNA polymerase sigma factor [Listeria phage LIS04]|nr:sigma-70 family RNA polymerase sigma factor [Listeria phage LIS04]
MLVNKNLEVFKMELQFSEKTFEIVKGVSRKYSRNSNLDAQDLEQELWLKLIEEARKNGDTPLNEKLSARTSFNKATDIYRKEKRRWEDKADMTSDEFVSTAAENHLGKHAMMAQRPFIQPEESLNMRELIVQFDEGTRERKFVVLKGYIEGVLTLEDATQLEPTLTEDKFHGLGKCTEHRIAKALDMKGAGSQSYRKLKRDVKKVMQTYFGE